MVNEGSIQNDITNVRACYKFQNLGPALCIMGLLTNISATANQSSSRRGVQPPQFVRSIKASYFFASTTEPSNVPDTQKIQRIVISLVYVEFSGAFQLCFHVSCLQFYTYLLS